MQKPLLSDEQAVRRGAELMQVALRTSDPAMLDRAVTLLRAGVAGNVAETTRREALGNLGIALLNRFDTTRATSDLDEAVQMAQARRYRF